MWINSRTNYQNLQDFIVLIQQDNVPYMEQSKASMGVITDIT